MAASPNNPDRRPLVSLVLATAGRVDPLAALLDTLVAQEKDDFEIILVDQNADERLAGLVAAYGERLAITHLRIPRRNSSVARNAGLPHCRGDIVGFPDDDCLYLPDTLARVVEAFRAERMLGVLTGPAQSPEGGLGSGRWAPARTPIGRHNVFTTVICFNMFLRKETLAATGGFDETLGVGAQFGSCEENDLVMRAVQADFPARYDPSLRIVHPDKRLTREARDRAFRYGAGFGRVLRKHHFPLSVVGTFLVRPIGGFAASLARLRPLAASYYARTFCGRLYGYCAREIRPAR